MKREIKFKAWDGESFKPLEDDGDYYFRDDGDGLRLHDKWGECKNVTLLQFTGLKDKNGVDIYEGDIALFNGRALQVRFGSYIEAWDGACPKDGHNAVGWFMSDEDEKCIKSLLTGWMLPNMKEIEVIGNIYEHTNLLIPQP